MIRILHIVTYMGRGGLETMLMNYYRHIDRSKIQFDFLVHRDFEADYDTEILSLGGKIYRMPALNPFSSGYKKALDSFFKGHPEYKIVHSHLDCVAGIPLAVAKKNGVSVCIAHAHNTNQEYNSKYLLKLFFKQTIPFYSDYRFACSEEAGKWMFGKHSFRVLNNAINSVEYVYNPEKAHCVRDSCGVENAFVVGHIGRFFRQKNHPFLLNLFKRVLEKEPTAMLMLVGDGPDRIKIEQQAKELGIFEKIKFMGVRSDVPDMLQAMDVFVFPSLFEGLGIAGVEAQAAGVPCVFSEGVPALCKMAEYVRFLSLKESVDTWADAIVECQNHKKTDQSQNIKDAGFDIEENALWITKFYLEVVKDAREN